VLSAWRWQQLWVRVAVYAVDIDPAATACARRNLAAGGGQVYDGDLYDPLPAGLRGHVDLLVANAPYVPTAALATLPAEARLYEPRTALDGGSDGLDVQRRVLAAAASWLTACGHVLVETSDRQSAQTVAAVAEHGLRARVARSADLGAVVVIGS